MASTTRVPLEVYFRTSYEPDAEYVDGQIEERPAANSDHSDWQQAICGWFLNHAREWNVRVFPELRVQVTQANYLIPDVTVLDRSLPAEQTITHPPLAVFEILSPEDTVKRLRKKLAEYAAMGIPQIWVVDPDQGSFERYEAGQLAPATRFEQGAIRFDTSEIASLLQS